MTVEKYGSRKFATMSARNISKALRLAQRKKIISKIPDDEESRINLLREIAVVSNNSQGFCFLEKQSA